MRSTARAREIAIFALYLLGTVYFTYPLVTGLDRLVTDLVDPLLNAWILSWDVHQLLRDPLHLFDANIFHPETGTLAFSEHLLGIAVVVAPVELLFRSPVLTHNLGLLFFIAVSGFTAYLLAAHLAGSRAAGFTAGSLFAFAPYRLGHLSHLQLQAAAGIPLVFLCLIRFRETWERRWLLALALSLFWVSTSCGYYGVFTWIALAVVVPFAIGWPSRRTVLPLAGTLALTALTLVPLARPYFRLAREFGFSRPLPRLDPASARFHSYVRSSIALHQRMGLKNANPEQRLFPGISLLFLALAGLLSVDRKTLPFLVLGGFAFWASLGPKAGLYAVLYTVVPGVSGLRVPARFAILVFLAMSLLAAGALAHLARRGPRLVSLLALLPLAELHRTPNRFVEAPAAPSPADRFLAGAAPPDAPVAHLPMPLERGSIGENAVYMLSSTIHFRPLVNGHSGFAPPSFYQAARALLSFPDEASLDLLASRGVAFVVLHKDRYLKARAAELAGKTALETRLDPVFDSDGETVYRLAARSSPAVRPPLGDLGRFFRFLPGVATSAYARIIDEVNELPLSRLQRPGEP
jgi:hypothetical protein